MANPDKSNKGKLADKSARLLRSMASRFGGSPGATCILGQYRWSYKGVPCGNNVRALERKGFGRASYYAGGAASFDLTEAGEAWAAANPGDEWEG